MISSDNLLFFFFSSSFLQVEVQYSMHPSTQSEKGRKQKSSTTVNLSLRPPSSHTHDSNEMKLEKNFTYTTSSFDEKKGIQSEFKIIIAPGKILK